MACRFTYKGKTYSQDELVAALKDNMSVEEAKRYVPGYSAPDMPFKQSWSDLGLKKMLHRAANEGYDAVSWTPGEQQAARYSLTNHLDNINVVKEGDARVWWPRNKNGKDLGSITTDAEGKITKAAREYGDIVGKGIDDVFGKDVAKRGMDSSARETKLDAEGLKFGGEGMKGFYDKMLVDKMNAMGKKFGTKVEYKELHKPEIVPATTGAGKTVYVLRGHDAGPFNSKAEAEKWMRGEGMLGIKVPFMRIPPAMREKILKDGLPMFTDSSVAGAPLAAQHSTNEQEIPRPPAQQHNPGYAHGGRVLASNINHAPTEAQQQAGNYRKDHISFQGLGITIENARGSTRSGVGPNGKVWSVRMPHHYGYIKGTVGADKDHVDCYIGPHSKSPRVYIVDQKNAESGRFDEHKCMLGFGSIEQVKKCYQSAFSDGKAHLRMGPIIEMTMDNFKRWVNSNAAKKQAVSVH